MNRLKWHLGNFLTKSYLSKLVAKLITNKIYSFKSSRWYFINDHISSDSKMAIIFGTYESAELRYVKKYLPLRKNVIELGSSLGFIAGHIQLYKQPKKLVCVEANPFLIDLINRNTAGMAQVFNGVVTEDQSDIQFRFIKGDSSVAGTVQKEGTTGIEIKKISIPQLIREVNQEEYVLICDIEGSEYDLLLPILESHKCEMLILETHEQVREKTILDAGLIKKWLKDNNYEIIDEYGPNLVATRNSNESKMRQTEFV